MRQAMPLATALTMATLFSTTAFADDVLTAPETVAMFFESLSEGDVETAVELTCPSESIPGDAMTGTYSRISKRSQHFRAIVAHLCLNDAAVVVFTDAKRDSASVDIDPAFCIRRDDKWLVLYKLTSFNRPELQLSEEESKSLQVLADWFAKSKPSIEKVMKENK